MTRSQYNVYVNTIFEKGIKNGGKRRRGGR